MAEYIILSSFLFMLTRTDVEAKTIRVQVQFILASRLLQNLRNIPGILDLSKVDITPALLDSLANQFC